jgi:hypothetical protein
LPVLRQDVRRPISVSRRGAFGRVHSRAFRLEIGVLLTGTRSWSSRHTWVAAHRTGNSSQKHEFLLFGSLLQRVHNINVTRPIRGSRNRVSPKGRRSSGGGIDATAASRRGGGHRGGAAPLGMVKGGSARLTSAGGGAAGRDPNMRAASKAAQRAGKSKSSPLRNPPL